MDTLRSRTICQPRTYAVEVLCQLKWASGRSNLLCASSVYTASEPSLWVFYHEISRNGHPSVDNSIIYYFIEQSDRTGSRGNPAEEARPQKSKLLPWLVIFVTFY